MVELRDIGYAAGGRAILGGITLCFVPETVTVLLGPNGAGKSTLLRIAAGLLRPSQGEVFYGSRPLAAFGPVELAQRRAVLSQHAEPAFPLTAEEVAEMGRYPHFRSSPSQGDRRAVARALDAVGMAGQRHQPFATLSAGERQKIQMARVLAQIDSGEPGRLLFLDEPTTSLDVHYQLQLLEVARGLTSRGVTVIAVLHDLNHAVEIADHLLVLEGGRLVHAAGRSEGLPEELIERVYRVRARRVVDPRDGRALWRFDR